MSRGAGTRHVRDGLCEDVPVCRAMRWDISRSHQSRGPGQPAQGHSSVCPLSPPLAPSPPRKHGQKSEVLTGTEGVSSKRAAGCWREELCLGKVAIAAAGCMAGSRATFHLCGTGARCGPGWPCCSLLPDVAEMSRRGSVMQGACSTVRWDFASYSPPRRVLKRCEDTW